MQTLFYFAGYAKDLPLALLKHANDSLREQNERNATVLKNPLRTIKLMTLAVKHDPHSREYRAHLNALLRQPNV